MLLVSAGYDIAVEQLPVETANGAIATVPLLPSCSPVAAHRHPAGIDNAPAFLDFDGQ
jgi:hypothetical protein